MTTPFILRTARTADYLRYIFILILASIIPRVQAYDSSKCDTSKLSVSYSDKQLKAIKSICLSGYQFGNFSLALSVVESENKDTLKLDAMEQYIAEVQLPFKELFPDGLVKLKGTKSTPSDSAAANFLAGIKVDLMENIFATSGAIEKFSVNRPKRQQPLQVEYGGGGGYSLVFKSKQNCPVKGSAISCRTYSIPIVNKTNAVVDDLIIFKQKENRAQLTLLKNRWQRYKDDSRNMSLLDTLFTSWHFSDRYKQAGFYGPPDYQLFALHPSVVFEHVSDAAEGERDKVGINLELVGFNDWDNKTLPFGVSVGAYYVDRVNTAEWAPSLMFHLANEYSIGYVFRDNKDGGNGIFFSVNILSLPDNKREKIKSLF